MCLVFAAALGVVFTGCEQRVVGVRNDWAGSQLPRNYYDQRPSKNSKDKGIVEGLGKAMFGWTDSLFGKKKRPKTTSRDVDLTERMTHTTTQSNQ